MRTQLPIKRNFSMFTLSNNFLQKQKREIYRKKGFPFFCLSFFLLLSSSSSSSSSLPNSVRQRQTLWLSSRNTLWLPMTLNLTNHPLKTTSLPFLFLTVLYFYFPSPLLSFLSVFPGKFFFFLGKSLLSRKYSLQVNVLRLII